MDARVDGDPVTAAQGKPVEINALWINGLAATAALFERIGPTPRRLAPLRPRAPPARSSAASRARTAAACYDVVDGPTATTPSVRPNQLLAVALPARAGAPTRDRRGVPRPLLDLDRAALARARLDPATAAATGRAGRARPRLPPGHGLALADRPVRATPRQRAGADVAGVLDGLEPHLREWGLGSVSETADGDAPHAATGCPFQAWSVAELLRARNTMR